jgi:hypothetical protein
MYVWSAYMRRTVWVSEELAAAVDAAGAAPNYSALLATALSGLLVCSHDLLRCERCGACRERHSVEMAAVSSLWLDVHRKLGDELHRGGTLQGFDRVLIGIGQASNVPPAHHAIEHRLSRTLRERFAS